MKAILKNFGNGNEKDTEKNDEGNAEVIDTVRKDLVVKSKRRIEQLNEYTCNERIIASSFFHVFLLGKAYQKDNGLLPVHHRHLLLQHTGFAGRSHDLIFSCLTRSRGIRI